MRGVYNIRVRAAVDQDPDPSPHRHEQDRHDQERAQKRRTIWWTVAIAAGVGAVGYLFVWPVVKRKFGGPAQPQPVLAEPPSTPSHAVSHVARLDDAAAPATPAAPAATTPIEPYLGHDLEQEARSRGFSSVADYENSVILNARELRRTGAALTLAPHLAHLAPRLYGP